MKVRVLGSSGAEFPGFNSPAFLIDDSLLLDAGTIGAVLGEAAQWKIRHVLVTHAHLDHIKGIPFLADNIILKNKKHSVTVMGIPAVLNTIKRNLLNDKVWPDFTVIPDIDSAVLKLKSIRPEKTFAINSYKITAYRVNHAVPAAGYIVESAGGRRLLYTGDTGPTERIWHATETPVHCAIIEVSMPNSMKEMAILTGHLTAGLLKEEIKKMKNIPERILITHPKPQYLKQIKKEVAGLRMKNIAILRDGEVHRI
ncbi:MAG: 3',5'-cyclic-nucleotide phosphodiesterase [Thermodesulfovibrionales bacterium]|nr:3',5'-cyclic-nucleotide phosphodiesterase [Thermodesulfovibrionales bacterium]